MKRKFLSAVITLSMVISLITVLPVFAENDINVKLDGETISFDVPPQIINERTMVPLRAVFEALGATVDWNQDTRTVISEKDGIKISLTIDSSVMYVNDRTVSLDSPACVIDNRTLVPIRAISEAYNATVDWDNNTRTVNITSSNTAPVPEPTPTSPAPSVNTEDTQNYSSSTVQFNEYSFYPTRTVDIECTNIIRGSKANSIIESENRFNDKPSAGQEWVIMEFDVKYISSTGGDNDTLKGSDIIYMDTFFTSTKSSLVVHSLATLGSRYGGNGVFDVELYPGGSGKVVIGLLIDSYAGDILLKVPKDAGKDITWINIGNSDNASSENVSSRPQSSNAKCYSGTDIPTYTDVTGIDLLRTTTLEGGGIVYIYSYTDADAVSSYWDKLDSLGWVVMEGDDTSTNHVFETSFYKNGDFIIVDVMLRLNEVWIAPHVE